MTNDHYNGNLKKYARELRTDTVSRAEKFLWKSALNRNQLGVKFKRQRPIDYYIVDFFSAEIGLIVEVDGNSHFSKGERDLKRQNRLESLGFKIIRFPEGEILNQFEDVYRKLNHVVHSLKKSLD